MSGLKKSTYGTPTCGPFADGTVQTFFRWSPEHYSEQNKLHKDLQLVKPCLPKDVVTKIAHIPVRRSS